jgi:hypothetical protein
MKNNLDLSSYCLAEMSIGDLQDSNGGVVPWYVVTGVCLVACLGAIGLAAASSATLGYIANQK